MYPLFRQNNQWTKPLFQEKFKMPEDKAVNPKKETSSQEKAIRFFKVMFVNLELANSFLEGRYYANAYSSITDEQTIKLVNEGMKEYQPLVQRLESIFDQTYAKYLEPKVHESEEVSQFLKIFRQVLDRFGIVIEIWRNELDIKNCLDYYKDLYELLCNLMIILTKAIHQKRENRPFSNPNFNRAKNYLGRVNDSFIDFYEKNIIKQFRHHYAHTHWLEHKGSFTLLNNGKKFSPNDLDHAIVKIFIFIMILMKKTFIEPYTNLVTNYLRKTHPNLPPSSLYNKIKEKLGVIEEFSI